MVNSKKQLKYIVITGLILTFLFSIFLTSSIIAPIAKDNFYISTDGIVPDNSIEASTLSGYDYMVDNGIYKAYFKENSNSQDFVKFQKDGYEIRYDVSDGFLNWIGKPGLPDSTSTLGGLVSSNSLDSIIDISDNIVSYNNGYGNTKIQYEIKNDRIKQTFVLSGLPSIKAYDELRYTGHIYFNKTLKICANGICYNPSGSDDTFFTSGTVEFKDATNKTIAYFDLPVIYDSAGNKVLGRYKIFGSDAQMRYEFRIPTSFLSTAVYPILVDPTTVIQSESSVVYERDDYNITSTIKRLNNGTYEIAPNDIFINNTNSDKLKFGAIDSNPLNSAEGSLNDYLYEFNSTQAIEQNANGYYLDEHYNIFQKISQFFGITQAQVTYIDTTDICKESYSDCIFNLSSDGKFLQVYFKAKVINGVVLIDPSYTLTYARSSADAPVFYNRTEVTPTGVRLNTPVLFMDFNSAPESTGRNSLSFDGVNEYVYTANIPSTKTSNYSISFWWSPTATFNSTSPSAMGLIGIDDGNNNFATIYLKNSTGHICFDTEAGTDNADSLCGTWNNWLAGGSYHIAITYDDTVGRKLYIEGSLDASDANKDGPFTGTNGLTIGGAYIPANDGLATKYFNGRIDEVAIWGKTLSSTEVATLHSSEYIDVGRNFADGTSMATNLSGLWHLDDASGTNAIDSSGNGKTGGLNNMESTDWVAGFVADGNLYVKDNSAYNNYGLRSYPTYNATGGYDVSGAYMFDGVNDLIQTPNIAGSENPFTLDAWVYLNSNTTKQGLITKMTPSIQWELTTQTTGVVSVVIYTTGSAYHSKSSSGLKRNQWYHIIGTYDGSRALNGLNLYVNGVSAAVTNSSGGAYTAMPTTSSPIYIGQGYSTTVLNGTIDQVQVLNRALSSAEVLALYNGTVNNSNYIGKYNLAGDFSSTFFYNTTQSNWNISLSLADTYSTSSGVVNNKNEINLSHPNLVSYWKLDNNFLDATGRNNGTAVGGVNNATGISSNAMRFDGVDDMINVTNNINIPANMTVGAWVYSGEFDQYGGIVSKGNSSAIDWGLTFWATTPDIKFFSGGTGTGSTVSCTTLFPSNNAWHYVVATRAGTMNTVYVDGSLCANKTVAVMGNGNNNLFLGMVNGSGGAYYFNGTIDEVVIYNQSLTNAQITQLYKSGLSQHATTNVTLQTRTANNYNISDTSLQLFFSFNNDSSTTVFDETGKNNWTINLTGTNPINNASSGLVGNGYYFDGTNDYIASPTKDFGNGWTQLTISMWMNPAAYTFIAGVVSSIGPSVNGFTFSNTGGRYYFSINGSDVFPAAAISNVYPVNTWHHYVGTYNGSLLTVYKDGVNVGTAVYTNPLQITENWYIGSYNLTASRYFKGSIDEVRIYNRSLSASEVNSLYNLDAAHIQDWSAWSSEEQINDGDSKLTSGSGKFMQFKANLFSNDTSVSPYVLSYNVSSNPVPADSVYPTFSNPKDNSNNLTNSGIGWFNITVNDTNGTVWLNVDGQNIYASNLSNVYNATYTFTHNGTYIYKWYSLGNGTLNNQNNSADYTYLIGNISINLVYPPNGGLLDRQSNVTINVSLTGDSNHLWDVTFFNATNPLVNTTLTTIGAVTVTTQQIYEWLNLVAATTYRWFVSITDGITTVVSSIFSFIPNDEPLLLNLRAETINNSQVIFMWENEPNMEWVSLFLGNEFTEIRSITSTYENWTVNNVINGRVYNFKWQVGDNLTSMGDLYNFDIRSEDWNPDFENYSYRRLITIDKDLITSDEDNKAIEINLTEDNFNYVDSWVTYPGFARLNYSSRNDIRFSNYYNTNTLLYNITSWNVPGNGGQSTQTIPDEVATNGTISDAGNMYDADWNTYSVPAPISSYFYNYSIPAGAKTSSQLRIYDGEWYWDGAIPTDCFGGTKLRFRSDLNYNIPSVNNYCQNNTDNSWILIDSSTSAYFYETMITWQYDSEVHLVVMPEHFNDTQRANVNGVDNGYDVKMWMYYGYTGATSNITDMSAYTYYSNVNSLGDEEAKVTGTPIISNLNDTQGRTATGTNITWNIDQDTDNRLRYATNQWLLGSLYSYRVVNVTENFEHLYGNQNNTVKLILYPDDYLGTISVGCSNASLNNSYVLNITASPIEITLLDVDYAGYLDWNITYTENKSWDRNTQHAEFKLENLVTDTQYWYEALAYGSTENDSETGSFILGTLPSTPNVTFYNYSEDRANKKVNICFNITTLDGAANVDFSVQYWNTTATSFAETATSSAVGLGVQCKEITVNYDTWNYRAKIIGSTTGYSSAYENEFMLPQEFFAGSYVTDDDDNLERQYCPPDAEGNANTTATCYEQKGYKEGINRLEDWIYIETNISGDTPYHVMWYNGSWTDNEMSVGTDFSYLELRGLSNSYQTFYIEDDTGNLILNWTKPSLTHLAGKQRKDESKYVAFNGTNTIQLINYTQFYFRPEAYPNTTAYRYCQAAPGGNLYDCMSVQYWGTEGVSALLGGTSYDRGQLFRGGVWNGEPFDTGILSYTLPLDRPRSWIQNAYAATNTTEARFCYSFTDAYHNESIYPTNNITNYYVRFWQETQHWSDYLGITQDVEWDYAGLFRWEVDSLTYTRDWLMDTNTRLNSSQIITVQTASNQTFGSIYNQKLIVGYKSGFNFDVTGYNLAETGFQTDGQWNNYMTGKYQRALLIYNLPDNATLQAMDSDSDGLTDFQELFTYYTDPRYNDTDEDGMLDKAEVDGSYDPNIWTSHAGPSAILISPINGSYLNNATQNLTANVTGYYINQVSLYINGVINSTITYLEGTAQTVVGVVVTLVDNFYQWFFSVTDFLGNTINSSVSNFTIDTKASLINIVYPLNATYNINISTLDYTYSNTDSNTNICYYTLNNGVSNITITCGNNVTGLTSTEGSNTWKVYVNDSAGNVNSSSLTFFKDTINPLAILNTPTNGTIIYTTYNNYTVNLTDNSTGSGLQNATLYIYNKNTNVLSYREDVTFNGQFNYSLGIATTLPEATYLWYYRVSDRASNYFVTENNTLDINSNTPVITIIDPYPETYFIPPVAFNISINEPTSWCGFSLNGAANVTMTQVNSTYWTYIDSYVDGSYLTVFTCNDTNGLYGSASVLYATDTVPPQISAEYPTYYQSFNTPNISFGYIARLNVTSIETCELWGNWTGSWVLNKSNSSVIDGESLFVNEFYVTGIPDGIHQYGIWCNSTAGTSDWDAQGNVTFIVDTTKPNVTLLAPANNTNSSNPFQTLSVNVTDNIQLANGTVYVYNTTGFFTSVTTILTGTSSIVNSVVTLVSDIYTWFYSVFDDAGNSFTSNNNTLTITDISAPTFVTIPNNLSVIYKNSISAQFTATDDRIFDSYFINDSRFTISNSGLLTNNTMIGVGYYNINVSINDSYNNLASVIYGVNVTQKSSSIIIYINGVNNNFTDNTSVSRDLILSGSILEADVGSTLSLLLDLAPIANPDTITLSNYQQLEGIVTASQNYTAAYATLYSNITDITAPSIVITNGNGDNILIDNNFTIGYTLNDTTAMTCSYNITGTYNLSNSSVTCIVGANLLYLNLNQTGTYTLNITVRDTSLNTNYAAITFTIISSVPVSDGGAASVGWVSQTTFPGTETGFDNMNISASSTWTRGVENKITIYTYNDKHEKVDINEMIVKINDKLAGQVYRKDIGEYYINTLISDENITTATINVTATQQYKTISDIMTIKITDKDVITKLGENIKNKTINLLEKAYLIITKNPVYTIIIVTCFLVLILLWVLISKVVKPRN